MMHQADGCSDLPSNVPSRPFPRSIIIQNHRHRVVTLRRCSHARSNTPTAGHHSADRDHDAEVLNILQRVLNTLRCAVAKNGNLILSFPVFLGPVAGSGAFPGRFVRFFSHRLSKNNEKIRKAWLMSAAIVTPPSPTSMPIPSFGRIEPGQTVIRSGRLYLMHGTVDDARTRY